MKKNTNKFIFLIIVIVSIALIVAISTYVLDTTGKVNQGNFRINDLVIKSTVDVKDKETTKEDATLNLSDMTLDISQNNLISILISKLNNAEVTSAYIDNIVAKVPQKKGTVTLSQGAQDVRSDLSSNLDRVSLNVAKQDDGQYLINLNVDNTNLLTNAKLPEGINSITYDGTILAALGIKTEELNISLQFDLNVLDSNGKLNKCKVKLNMPTDTLLKSGISIDREDINNFVFSVK